MGLQIIYHPHFVKRWRKRGINLDKVEETIKTGRVVDSYRNKRVLERYFGKENQTYTVICLIEEDDIEVRTTWIRKGR
ncbi:DUF4258 domain-containing protein [Thermoproteota archaeon]